ncbi:MDR family oxidoreductase [Mycetocola zhadangensis]|uniref:Oxidoreductase n=1 Tax=Mycetocola zhadangensis TaxID=1164595 RepID=A0A3L7J0R4_9MICO|nr:MDR family oxidoreductase [Mycetocola zhadangensis]RLQ83949.1 oxidoreductase [Mycetocola zhadangensis]GGE97477.1 quinone oxidoreductase YhdH/YhfP family protein [Mycetocola zhadangensis]
MTTTFRAWLVEKQTDASGSASQTASVSDLTDEDLMPGNVSLDVSWSSINFKDGLALTGKPGVVRAWPLIPGIDVVGTVTSSETKRFAVGDEVLLNGAGLGETHHGGLAQRARVDSASLVRVPTSLGAKRSAAIGTAGFTAMLSVLAVERHGVTPGDGPVLVTGAAGGVGSIAIALLAKLGFEVVASTGRADSQGDYLRRLGANSVIDRAEISEAGKPLQSQTYAAVVDAVGSTTLVNALAQLNYGGIATACGLAQGADLPGTVMPFILRGVTLAGINSVDAPLAMREEAWNRLATDLDTDILDELTTSIGLEDAADAAGRILKGELHGRTVVDVSA